jgi:hypothetical protein
LTIVPSITLGENTVIKNIYCKGPGDVTLLEVGYSYEHSMLANIMMDS